jgi:diaminohydroxyphosphoribosylaminopyrimidine deaminase/5-amino-6-(5-phosphoribosylamino)uracil reductase
MTLDGKIAPPPGESATPSALGAFAANRGWITGEAAHAHVQELRHASDAILVGVGTAIADDPLLTDRSGKPRRRPLLRVVLDSRLRLPVESRLVKTANHDVLIFCGYPHPEKRAELESRGVRVEQLALNKDKDQDGSASHPGLVQVMQRLGQMEITSLLIEGGALVNSSALSTGVVDKLFLYYAPKILGSSGVQFMGGSKALEHALEVKSPRLHQFGEDFAVEGYLRDPYE